ncbi:MAG: hypothetical protein Q4A01_11190 [Coriobacteriales bacterium]|nr:hypothetical protein [Coriobacteriales bacterium]
METKTRRLFGILLILSIAMGMGMCRTAYATIEEYPLWVGGTQVTSDNTSWTDDPYHEPYRGGWSYDVDTNTLTLDALTIDGGYEEEPVFFTKYKSGIRYSGSRPLIISLKGNNLIAVTSNEDERKAIGIFSDQGQVAIR